MITFEDIINEKDKQKRDLLIKEKLNQLNKMYDKVNIDTRTNMTGFISNESKISFSDYHYDMNIGLGSIYGMKTEDYFYDFFDFLNDHNLTTKQEVIKYISPFLKNYFNEQGSKINDREELFEDIWNQLDKMYDDKERFNKNKNAWLDIGIFKNRSAAECTEHACITQNLLTFCDIDSCYVSGHIKSNTYDEDHAFNIFKLNGEYYLLDSTNPYCLYDGNDNYVGCSSYFAKISNEAVKEFIQNQGKIILPKCNYMKTNQGKTIIVDKDINNYTTSSKFLNIDNINDFFDINKKAR